MRELINDNHGAQGPDETSGRKTWQAPSLLRLDAENAETNPGAGVDGFGSAS
ncbi:MULTISPECIES: hypothetical protein [unclassified Brevundimonas]|jgi:hypothetical protein|uniref:hypothetical protein n=1 Tax=unclassified Brevundimonas TaxID=2622653 RepID=UPI00257D8E50|nr:MULTISPECIES: hypothetical protein [unclassified Brevundimonas]|tara:strand:+ start:5282 stop:5437 length:156 start_codon:yes stop_codon:yes gene_type:complete